jgi:hypothetical protein
MRWEGVRRPPLPLKDGDRLLVSTQEGEERSLPRLRHAKVGKVSNDRKGAVVLGKRVDEKAGGRDGLLRRGVANLSGEERLHVLDDERPRCKESYGLLDDGDEEVAAIPASDVGIGGVPTGTLCRAKPLTGRARCEQCGACISSPFPVRRHDVGQRLSKVAGDASRVRMVEERDVQSTRVEFCHDVKAKACLGKADVPCATVAKEADGP